MNQMWTRRIATVVVALILLPAVGLAVFRGVGSSHASLGLLLSLITLAVLAGGTWLCRPAELGRARLAFVATLVAVGMTLFASAAPRGAAVNDDARLLYPDGTTIAHAAPSDMDAWGGMIRGYYLHPAYPGVSMPDRVDAHFASHSDRIILRVSKPADAVFDAKGMPTPSDGVMLHVEAFDAAGRSLVKRDMQIASIELLQRRRVRRDIEAHGNIAKVTVQVLAGPPGSTAFFDSTVLGFEPRDALRPLQFFGQVLLAGWAFLAIGLGLAGLRLPSLRGPRTSRAWLQLAMPVLVLIALIVGAAWWWHARTDFAFFWDYRNYWEKTEALYAQLAGGGIAPAATLFGTNYAADYGYLPAVLPAALGVLLGTPTRMQFGLLLTLVYAVPAYIAVAWLACRLLGDVPTARAGRTTWCYAAIPVFLAVPVFFTTVLLLMPDIGGVVPFVVSIVCAAVVVEEVFAVTSTGSTVLASRRLLSASLTLGLMFSLMFLFRRWYAFGAAGVVVATTMAVVAEFFLRRNDAVVTLRRLSTAGIVIAFGTIPFLCWIAFDWLQNPGRHDYATLYASYKAAPATELASALLAMGVLVPAMAVGLLGLAPRLRVDRRLLFILVAASAVAGLLFLRVQSPGPQHYYLLMPLLGAPIAVMALVLRTRTYVVAAVLGLGLLASLGTAALSGAGDTRRRVLPDYSGWQPREQPHLAGYRQTIAWLTAPARQDKTICVIASGGTINQGVFSQLWQIDPRLDRVRFDARLLLLGQVDSQHGAPVPAIRRCDLAVVGEPFQRHLRPGEQLTLEIVHDDLVHGTGIGAAYGRAPAVIPMEDGIRLLIFSRERDVTDAEYTSLVERFLAAKGYGFKDPSQ